MQSLTFFQATWSTPLKVVRMIEKMMRDFFWEGKGEGVSDHLVKWDIVAKPKTHGGLGIGNLKWKNLALLGKWLWHFPIESDSLWHTIILSHYGLHSNGWDASNAVNSTLWAPWRSIARVWDIFVQNTKLIVGHFPSLFRLSNKYSVISDIVSFPTHSNPFWNLEFSRNLNDRECEEFTLLLHQLETANLDPIASDRQVWKGHPLDNFSCKSFLNVILQPYCDCYFPQFSFIWKGVVPSKIKVFAWLASLGNVNTCDLLQSKRPCLYISPSFCIMCRKASESIDHILIHCDFARGIWSRILSLFGERDFATQLGRDDTH